MADTEKKVIIEVGTGQSAQTLGQLREAVIDAQKSLLMLGAEVKNGTKSEEEYQQALVQAKVAQEQYNKEMRVQVKENQAVKGSYNDLVNQLSRLKEQWKNAAPGTEKYRQLTAEVNAVKKQLESQDHEIGNWQRNVGNYANSLAGIFRGVGGGIGAAAQGIVGLNTKMTALSANPAMAVLSVLAVVLQKISEAFSSSEAAANKLAVGFAPLKAGGQALTRVFQSVANALGSAAEWMTKMADKLGWLSDEQKKNVELTKSEIALREEQRRVNVENARLEMEIAEARAKAQDKANYSASERVKLLAEVRQKEKQILENQLRIAEEEYRIAKEKSQLTENDAAANDELADKEANLYRIREQHATGMRRINREYTQALKDQGVELANTEKTLREIFQLANIKDDWPTFDQLQRKIDSIILKKDELYDMFDSMLDAEIEAGMSDIDALF
ncbi:MAG: hypothetical protein KBS70_05710, partial [Bacteroidales bacterium]|nr:hypothetical protein [Candidatus Colicola equi]